MILKMKKESWRNLIMKKTLFLAVFIAIAALSFAAITSITVDWSADVAGLTGSASFGSYNFATGHFLICDYSAKTVRIANGTTGALLGTLNMTGVTYGTGLGVFAAAATSDGVIYGGCANVQNISGSDVETQELVRWADEAAAPTQQVPAPLGTITMQFARTMDILGTGVDTIIATAGSNNGIVTILTTTNGTTFAVTDATPDLLVTPLPTGQDIKNSIKQSVALVPGMQKIFGSKADGAGYIAKQIKNGTAWETDPGFTNEDAYGTHEGLGMIAYAPGHDTIVGISYANTTAENIYVFDGTTGAENTALKTVLTGINAGT